MKQLLAILMVLMISVSFAFADESSSGLTYSERFKAVSTAQHALAEKYSISEGYNEYFMRTVIEEYDGSYTIYWQPAIAEGAWPWLLGTYTAVVHGEDVAITWTHDDDGTYGGYTADAWGALQLHQIADEVKTTFEMTESYTAAMEKEYPADQEYPYIIAAEDFSNMEEQRQEALAKATITPDEADAAARMALQEIYGQLDWSRLETTDREFNWSIGLLNERPVILIHYDLWGQGSDEWEWQEGDGYYVVTVNLKTGEIEEILYANGLSGNG